MQCLKQKKRRVGTGIVKFLVSVLLAVTVFWPLSAGEQEFSGTMKEADRFFEGKLYKEAATLYSDVLNRSSDTLRKSRAQMQRGWCRYRQKRFGEALKDFEEVLNRINPAGRKVPITASSQKRRIFKNAYLGRILSLMCEMRDKEAIESAGKFPELAEEAGNEMLSIVYYLLGEHDKAVEASFFKSRAGFDVAADGVLARNRVISVDTDGPAYKAGLRPGDIVTAINGESVATALPLIFLLPGRSVLDIERKGRKIRLDIVTESIVDAYRRNPNLQIALEAREKATVVKKESSGIPPASFAGRGSKAVPSTPGSQRVEIQRIPARIPETRKMPEPEESGPLSLLGMKIVPSRPKNGESFEVLIDLMVFDPNHPEEGAEVTLKARIEKEGRIVKRFKAVQLKVPVQQKTTISKKIRAGVAGNYLLKVELEYQQVSEKRSLPLVIGE